MTAYELCGLYSMTSSCNGDIEDKRVKGKGEDVYINVYDMYWTNEYTTTLGLGVYHTGIQVYGKEYAFGGHPFPFTGIFEIEPLDVSDLGEQFVYKETITLGKTDLLEEDVVKVVDCLGKKYPGDAYHLIHKNCNHFTQELVQILVGKEMPSWINRLASVGARLPFMERMLPKEWLTPLALVENNSLKEPEPTDVPARTPSGSELGSKTSLL